MPAKVVVYSTDYCPYCLRAKALLSGKGVAFTEIDVTEDEAKRQWLVKVTGLRTVPQIFINDKAIGGFDDLADLDARGALDTLLAESP